MLKRYRIRGRCCGLCRYDLMTTNHPATIGPSGPRPRAPAAGGAAPAAGGGAGPRSGWKRYTLCVFGSTAIVFAPANVGTVATTVYLSGGILVHDGDVALAAVRDEDQLLRRIPAQRVDARAVRRSTRRPCPWLASTTTDVLLQPEKMRFDALS